VVKAHTTYKQWTLLLDCSALKIKRHISVLPSILFNFRKQTCIFLILLVV